MKAQILSGIDLVAAKKTIIDHHYTHSIPSGKSHWLKCGDAIVVWSIPANKNIAKFVLGWNGLAFELSRLWAPDGHDHNLLTQAISAAVKWIDTYESPDVLVSYADPNVGHKGGVYRAASWIYHGKSAEQRTYVDNLGRSFARRAFHSGKRSLTKAEIESKGFKEVKLPGKERFIKPISILASKVCKYENKMQNL